MDHKVQVRNRGLGVPIRRVPLSTRVFENFRFYDRLRKGGGVGVSAYREVESGDWAGMTGNGHGC